MVGVPLHDDAELRSVLEVGRGNRTILYNIKATRPPPLVPRSRVFEVDERSYYDGTIARAADPAAVAPIAAVLAEAGIAAVAICFLHAYANDLSLTESELYYCRKARAEGASRGRYARAGRRRSTAQRRRLATLRALRQNGSRPRIPTSRSRSRIWRRTARPSRH
jgi:hypothetical protein